MSRPCRSGSRRMRKIASGGSRRPWATTASSAAGRRTARSTTPRCLIDHEQLYTLFLTDYEFYEKLMTFAMTRILDYARAMDEAGVDVQCVGGNVPGGFLGKKTYDRYILPFERKYIEFLQRERHAGHVPQLRPGDESGRIVRRSWRAGGRAVFASAAGRRRPVAGEGRWSAAATSSSAASTR